MVLNSTYHPRSYRFSFYDQPLLLFDYKNKRITFPITFYNFSTFYYANYSIHGYLQLYIDPYHNGKIINAEKGCFSTLPISTPC